jgi:hypothetical protein
VFILIYSGGGWREVHETFSGEEQAIMFGDLWRIQANQKLALSRLMHSIHCGCAVFPYQALATKPAQETSIGCMGLRNKEHNNRSQWTFTLYKLTHFDQSRKTLWTVRFMRKYWHDRSAFWTMDVTFLPLLIWNLLSSYGFHTHATKPREISTSHNDEYEDVFCNAAHVVW